MPQKDMGQHTGGHVMIPAGVFAHFIVRHTPFRLRFLKALLNSPPHATEPHQKAQRRARGRMTDVVRIRRVRPEGTLDHEPHGPFGEALFAQGDPVAAQCIHDGAFRAFGDRAAIPSPRRQTLRQGRHRARCLRRRGDHAFGADFPFVPIGMLRGRWTLEPTPRLGGHGHQRRHSKTGIERVKEVRAVPIEAIGHNRLEGETVLALESLSHLHGQLRFGVQYDVIRHVALGPSVCIICCTPRRRHEEPCIHQGIAMP